MSDAPHCKGDCVGHPLQCYGHPDDCPCVKRGARSSSLTVATGVAKSDDYRRGLLRAAEIADAEFADRDDWSSYKRAAKQAAAAILREAEGRTT